MYSLDKGNNNDVQGELKHISHIVACMKAKFDRDLRSLTAYGHSLRAKLVAQIAKNKSLQKQVEEEMLTDESLLAYIDAID